ncbi:MAG: DUF4381 domain-containing protein [Proteobacteria bacterium]|nr:DUF4381 domain-containing protein [Pseudomonadota bacterium]
MDNANPLANLRDIHLPETVGFWPFAFGWYILFLLLLSLILFFVYRRYQYQRKIRAQVEALKLLKIYEQQYLSEKNSPKTAMQISELLRRVALAYYPREQVAGINGEAWLRFLQENSKKADLSALSNYLLHLPYMQEQQIDLTPLFNKAKLWIEERGQRV